MCGNELWFEMTGEGLVLHCIIDVLFWNNEGFMLNAKDNKCQL